MLPSIATSNNDRIRKPGLLSRHKLATKPSRFLNGVPQRGQKFESLATLA
jgi:hypothetical protein